MESIDFIGDYQGAGVDGGGKSFGVENPCSASLFIAASDILVLPLAPATRLAEYRLLSNP